MISMRQTFRFLTIGENLLASEGFKNELNKQGLKVSKLVWSM